MSTRFIVPALLLNGAAGAAAQSSVTAYGRLDLSLAQQADASANKEVRNGSGSPRRVGDHGAVAALQRLVRPRPA